MKRATLSAYPPPQPSQPTDLTDRLLAREASQSAEPPKKRRRAQPRGERAGRAAPPNAPPPAAAEPPPSPAEPANRLAEALAASDLAIAALGKAGHEAPARYDVALRYRLDALAHHLQQVKEFVAALAQR